MRHSLLEAARWILQDGVDESFGDLSEASLAWLRDAPLKALHPSGLELCIGALTRLAIVYLGTGSESSGPVKSGSILQQAVAHPDHITALCWSCFGEPHTARCKESYILVGTATGYLQVHSDGGALLHRQRLHTSAVTSIRMRVAGMHISADDASEDVTVCFEDAAACFSSIELRSLVYIRREVGPSNRWPTLGFNKWDTSRSAGKRSDALCLGSKSAGLYSVMTNRDTSTSLLLLTVGRSPCIAAFEVKEHAPQGALALVSDMASTAVTGMAGLAKAALVGREDGYRAGLRKWLRRRGESESSEAPNSPMTPTSDGKEEVPQAAEPAALWRSFKDDARCITSLTPAPRGSLAAVTDNLGRVLLIDAASAAVLRIFKGYRNAQCAWLCLQAPMRPSHASASAAGQQSGSKADGPSSLKANQSYEKQQHRSLDSLADSEQPGTSACNVGSVASPGRAAQWHATWPPDGSDTAAGEQLFLAVHAPNRRAVEVWETAYGPRLCSIKVGPECCMLSAAPVFGKGQRLHRENLAAQRPGKCWLLDSRQGQLQSLEDAVLAALSKGVQEHK
ncbi:probable rab3 GTPase-activating protein non-catalytic subunit [Coccomyxa sp. Obi]|nr:probable rab3 GTPase-activating protein non-catalytic subunit [Coccomyxa sp. Obi]